MLGSAALLAAAAGCTTTTPPGFARREKLSAENVAPTNGVMFGMWPYSFESSVGRVTIETLEEDYGTAFSRTFSRVFQMKVAGDQAADVTCVHESVGSTYPPGFEFANSGAFACRGTTRTTSFTLAIERGCYDGALAVGDTERFKIARGKVTLGGVDVPSDEVSLLDAHGDLAAAFDLGAWVSRVWMAGPAGASAARAPLILSALAISNWSNVAAKAKRDACN